MFPQIRLSDYYYELPEDRIAHFPVSPRDHSRLLRYKQGRISDHKFYEIADLLPKESLLVMNDTRVVPARLYFQRASGAKIEVLLLKSLAPSPDISFCMQSGSPCSWECMIGNLKKWKDNEILKLLVKDDLILSARLSDRDKMIVELSWNGSQSLAELLNLAGKLPLPPYITRPVQHSDLNDYQTTFALKEGAVAAPTAGLHFSSQVFDELSEKGIETDFLTLHVGAGTFQPVKSEVAAGHPMHSEQFRISSENLKKWISFEGKIIAVGTTSVRTLETAYWLGVKLLRGDEPAKLSMDYPYETNAELPPTKDALSALLQYLESAESRDIVSETAIFIVPGYQFRVCNGIITNFHMPGTTLILLIAAFLGEDWKKVYEHALSNEYRFLSYGDSSLLLP